MRILSCHITGFGKLVNLDFNFEQISSFKQDNGWGKTTLATFLECMFFGMEAGRGKEVGDNPRLKYEPWSGAAYGGTLVFSYGQKQYRLERFFGKTPAYDTVKIYDENQMLSYEFGDKGERLGETLFGLDRESYRRCAYFAQGDLESGVMTGTIRERLIALLGAGDTASSQTALARLDEAERALRAKRKPAKGKLDELDERLAFLEEQRAELYRVEGNLAESTDEYRRLAEKKLAFKQKLDNMDLALEAQARRNERAAAQAAYLEVKAKLDEANEQKRALDGFFGDTNAEEVNADGLATAIGEYYSLQEELKNLQPKLEETEEKWRDKQAVKSQLDNAEKSLKTYRLLAEEKRKSKAAGKRATEAIEEKSVNKKRDFWLLFIATALSLGGIALADVVPLLGIGMLVAGGLWLVVTFFIALTPVLRASKKKVEEEEMDDETAAQLTEANEEINIIRAKLEQFPANLRRSVQELTDEIEKKQGRMSALKTAIENFLHNFAYETIYDYRAALDELKNKIAQHAKYGAVIAECEEKMQRFAPADTADLGEYAMENADALRAKRDALQIEKDELERELARAKTSAEEWERRIDAVKDALAEEQALRDEKSRLENRLVAVRAAREFLTRARENMAKRYLDPVQKRVGDYQKALGFEDAYKIRFSGVGEPILEEQGVLRSTQFYSEGMHDLLSLCVRLALSEALVKRETPPLILDDPLINLDDESTERAKRLIKALGKTRQIIYFTCKSERSL